MTLTPDEEAELWPDWLPPAEVPARAWLQAARDILDRHHAVPGIARHRMETARRAVTTRGWDGVDSNEKVAYMWGVVTERWADMMS